MQRFKVCSFLTGFIYCHSWNLTCKQIISISLTAYSEIFTSFVWFQTQGAQRKMSAQRSETEQNSFSIISLYRQLKKRLGCQPLPQLIRPWGCMSISLSLSLSFSQSLSNIFPSAYWSDVPAVGTAVGRSTVCLFDYLSSSISWVVESVLSSDSSSSDNSSYLFVLNSPNWANSFPDTFYHVTEPPVNQ